jgi:hypothetical protein
MAAMTTPHCATAEANTALAERDRRRHGRERSDHRRDRAIDSGSRDSQANGDAMNPQTT